MSRGIGEFQYVQEAIPEWLAVFIALLTQLGDVWFVSVVLAVCYWTYRRESSAIVVARTIGGLGLLYALKYWLELPRPERPLLAAGRLPWIVQPLYEATAFADGYGFPSGHALVTTIVYVSLAGTLSIGSRRQRYAAAAAIVTVVGFSRVALGVHFLVDIVAGVLIGLAYIAFTRLLFERYPRERATVAFALAVCFAGAAVLESGVHADSLVLLGAALGGLGGWATYRLATTVVAVDRRALVHLVVIVLAFAPLIASLEVFGVLTVHGLMSAVGFAVAGAIVLPLATTSPQMRESMNFLGFCWTVLVWNVRSLDPRREHDVDRKP